MTKYFFIIAFIISTLSAKSQIINDSVLVEGHYRTFHFLKPTQTHASLVFVLHGSGGNGLQNRGGAKKIEEIAPTENILLVYPDGYKRFWNECRKTANSAANLENINENAFFSLMIEYFEKHYKIDAKKIFAVGTSGGGHMAYKLGLTMPEKFKAITAIIANLPDTNNIDCVEKHVPIPVMIINGTADKTNPYEGGEVIIQNNLSLGFVRSTNRTFEYWSSLAGYKGTPKMESLPDNDPNDGKTIERYTFKEKNKPEVTLLKVIGGKHDYPNDINVYLEAWEFFKRQMK
ncbi:polyhydroxybutyrate depolymerase [Arcicella aurantiaca]|uniref:Polyhydroxybutyrate depolymerase n=1 Tax=Arcicella aurantiaca TaxID=591202 RepID=A0A316DPV7_9BACT|nr:poly(3-hydroxybutyrate) depolymerase [Arcicella aurantiaca]PWK18793.1 polyhydroxybutyrate depolymerase [Arcicella aurantiaca]